MTISLGLNISSLIAQRQLSRSSDELSNVFTRLSSGQRINRASDDAAGLTIADSLNADARVYNQGVRNLNDGISVLNIADGALQELTNITFRLTELAEQAANGTLGNLQRASLDEEAQALKAEYFRIAKSTEFNGRKLFEGDYGVLSLQAGYGTNATLSNGLGGAIGSGEFAYGSTASVYNEPEDISVGDLNGDGFLDVVTNSSNSTLAILLGNGNGSFTLQQSIDTQAASAPTHIADMNNDGILDIVVGNGASLSTYIGNGNGTFASPIDSSFTTGVDLKVGDFNGDGNLDVVTKSTNATVILGDGQGGFTGISATLTGVYGVSLVVGDFNGDGISDIAGADYSNSRVAVALGNGDGTFASTTYHSAGAGPNSLTAGDFDGDGNTDLVTADYGGQTISVLYGVGDGTFASPISYSTGFPSNKISSGDFNGDGYDDIGVTSFYFTTVGLFQGSSSRELSEQSTLTAGTDTNGIHFSDFDADGVLDFIVAESGDDALSFYRGETLDGVSPLLDFSLGTIADAKQALSQFSQKLDQLSTQRGQIGAFQSRIEVAENVLSVSAENFKAAESRIRDADIAEESARLVRLQILQQAASAVLGQANQQPQLVLQLLSSEN